MLEPCLFGRTQARTCLTLAVQRVESFYKGKDKTEDTEGCGVARGEQGLVSARTTPSKAPMRYHNKDKRVETPNKKSSCNGLGSESLKDALLEKHATKKVVTYYHNNR